ncbi:hypothetical protein BSG1_17040 [Bacillus sp. SG-1]|jgi:hypothetical protein|nr:hypothetical protein BSG1_17040 [Bacillus sp. SG-1]
MSAILIIPIILYIIFFGAGLVIYKKYKKKKG